jgi:hypothetical protein
METDCENTEYWTGNITLEDGECCLVFRNDGSEDLVRQYDISGQAPEKHNNLRMALCMWALNNPRIWEQFAVSHFDDDGDDAPN